MLKFSSKTKQFSTAAKAVFQPVAWRLVLCFCVLQELN